MTRFTTVAAAALIALTLPCVAIAQGHGGGNGHGGGAGKGPDRAQGPGQGGGPGNGGPGNGRGNGGGRADRGPAVERSPARVEQRVERDLDRARVRMEQNEGPGRVREVVRTVDPRAVDTRLDVRGGDRIVFRQAPDRGLIAGCPPGLAKKDNGCLPPGQARQIDRARDDDRYDRYGYLWNVRNEDYAYRYRDGYLYRLNPQGALLGYLPVLGGALWTGNVWPTQYAYDPVPAYYSQYYGLNDGSAYRYADGVLYGVNPQNQSITQIAALLTGQMWNVGQRMPAGYDIYNVPYAYRSQYVDSPQSMYRYSDGYVYQVDPQTHLIQTVIQLLT